MCVSFATSPSVSSAQGHLVAVYAAALMTKSLFSRLRETEKHFWTLDFPF